jgi:CheY-like chemotaxis protein
MNQDPVEKPADASHPVKILLAEDDLGDANLTLEVFKSSTMPVEITRVKDGEEALAYLKKEGDYAFVPSPDLIFLDINMPRVNGLEVLEVIKNDSELKKIPVLMLTCSRSDEDKKKAYESKANFYMVKPTDLNEFFEFVKYVEQIWIRKLRPIQ